MPICGSPTEWEFRRNRDAGFSKSMAYCGSVPPPTLDVLRKENAVVRMGVLDVEDSPGSNQCPGTGLTSAVHKSQ